MIAESSKPDKFLIKYVPIAADTSSSGNFIELFKTVEVGAQEHRLKCAVLQPDGSALSYASGSPLQQHGVGADSTEATTELASSAASIPPAVTVTAPPPAQPVPSSIGSVGASPAKPASKPVVAAPSSTASDPRDAKIQSLTTRNAELTKQIEDLQKLVTKNASTASAAEVPPEWVALLNSQTGFPPVLVVLVALFSFLVGLLF